MFSFRTATVRERWSLHRSPSDRVAEFTVGASNDVRRTDLWHLQRFKRYPLAAHGASGSVLVQFQLNRSGEVISSKGDEIIR